VNSNKTSILKAAAILGIPILLLFLYQYSPLEIQLNSWTLKKMDQESEIPSISIKPKEKLASSQKISAKEKKKNHEDQVISQNQAAPDTTNGITNVLRKSTVAEKKVNSIPQRILLLGDSETGGLKYPLNDYCVANGHKLEAVFTWFSASILNFGYSNKVDEILNKYKPSLVIFVVGLNEMYVRDLKRRKEAAELFLQKLGDTPYLWVGPANFTLDKGINSVFEATAAPGSFLLSKDLELPRGRDQRHPNKEGYKIWMDYIANYIQTTNAYPFNFLPPSQEHVKMQGRIIFANAAKDKGY